MTIDIGNSGETTNYVFSSRTIVEKSNPANATGTIDYLKVRIYADATLDVGCFSASGDNLTCLATHCVEGLSASAGVNEFNAPGDFTAFNVDEGDYIGAYTSTYVNIESSGGSNVWYAAGDKIPTSAVGFSSLSEYWACIYGEGAEVGAAIAPTAIFDGPLVGPLGGPL